MKLLTDTQWLLDTHLKGVPSIRPFKSFVLHGNEDAPTYLELYESENPNVGDKHQFVNFDLSSPFYCEVEDK